MSQCVEIAINLSQIDESFTYHLPANLVGKIQPGCLVVVPFGGQRVQGVVTNFTDTPNNFDTLAVEMLVSEEPVFSNLQIELARWLAKESLSPLGACIRLMIPPGLSQKADILVTAGNSTLVLDDLPPGQKNIMDYLLTKGSQRGSQLDVAFRHANWRSSLASLKQKGFVTTFSYLPPSQVNPKTIRKAHLNILPHQIDDPSLDLGRITSVIERRKKVLSLLASDPLPIDFSWIYAQSGATYTDLKRLADEGIIQFVETEIWRDPLETIVPTQMSIPQLTQDQEQAWQEIRNSLHSQSQKNQQKPILLHGVTGSGKTEIYMRSVADVLENEGQALILVPEIALTPQVVRRFMLRFPNQVGIYHSRLSNGERYDTWRRASRGDLRIIVGARSALFMPLRQLKLIVLDECDHESYDQVEQLPYYHTVETAQEYARLTRSLLLLGSATPRVTQYYQTQIGTWRVLSLPKRVFAYPEISSKEPGPASIISQRGNQVSLDLPGVKVIDMRDELKAGVRGIFSRELESSMKEVISKNEQAILFLNRKGTASYIFCRECGYVMRCPRDDKPLTYHSSRSALVCHTCGYTRKIPSKCPQCGSNQIRQFGIGTERVEAVVQELIPGVRTLRWDADTTGQKGAHDLILSHFCAHRADVLIGTQMLAKGLDLPLVTLVGVILADIGLTLPDYRAGERTFQLLTQVAGRAGRSPLGGKVVFQTYMPENPAIQAAAKHDYMTFYTNELDMRMKLNYPPFTRIIRLEYRHKDAARCEANVNQLAGVIHERIRRSGGRDSDLIGPVPCFFSRLGGLYRWQVILRSKDPFPIIDDIIPHDWIVEVDPPSLL